MKVRVKFFASHREAVGKAEEELQIEANSKVKDAMDRLVSKHPKLGGVMRKNSIYSLNQNIVYSAISQAALGLSYPGTPLYLLSEGLGAGIINAILSSVAIASLLGQVVWGYLSDRMFSKLAYVEMGCAGSAIGFLVLACAHDALAFAAFYVISGFVGSAAYPAAMALLADISPAEKRGRSMGIFWSAASIGWAIAVAFTGWIIENLGGPYLFGSCALLYAASLLIIYLGFRGHWQLGDWFTYPDTDRRLRPWRS